MRILLLHTSLPSVISKTSFPRHFTEIAALIIADDDFKKTFPRQQHPCNWPQQTQLQWNVKLDYVFDQERPRVLCLSATMTELTETITMGYLGLDPETTTRLSRNPVNKRISLINLPGHFKIGSIVDLLRGGNCPRIIIFETGLRDCGSRYLEFKQANKSFP